MRTIFTIFALLALSSCLFAQEDVVDISLPLRTGQKVILNLRFADKIEVKTWDKKELFIRANVHHQRWLAERCPQDRHCDGR